MFEYVDAGRQLEMAKRVFDTARAKSRFYARKYEGIGEIRSRRDWLEVPLLERDELYNNCYPFSTEMLTDEPRDMVVFSTGGSTGVARYSVYSHTEFDLFVDLQAKALKLQGVSERDIVANLFVAGNLWPSFIGGHEVIKKLKAVHLPIAAQTDFERLLWFIRTFRATVLLCVPTLLVYISDLVLEEKRPVDSVRLIHFVGEPMSENARGYVKKAFPQAEIKAAAYSSADCGIIGYQCDMCSQDEYHMVTELQMVEVIDPNTKEPCPEGETGELIITTLRRTLAPVIRYRLGDIGYIKREPCRCGDKNPTLVLKGRAGEDFKLAGAYITMGEIEKALKGFIGVDGITPTYQLELDEDERGRMGFVLRIESTSPEKSEKHKEAIKGKLAEEIHMIGEALKFDYFHTYEVEFVPAGSLPRNPITGKAKRLMDRRISQD